MRNLLIFYLVMVLSLFFAGNVSAASTWKIQAKVPMKIKSTCSSIWMSERTLNVDDFYYVGGYESPVCKIRYRILGTNPPWNNVNLKDGWYEYHLSRVYPKLKIINWFDVRPFW